MGWSPRAVPAVGSPSSPTSFREVLKKRGVEASDPFRAELGVDLVGRRELRRRRRLASTGNAAQERMASASVERPTERFVLFARAEPVN